MIFNVNNNKMEKINEYYDNAISSKELKEKFNIAHPIQTSSTIKKGDVENLMIELDNRNEL